MDKKEYAILCIFTPTGRTYTFKNVWMVCDNETVLQFEYAAMSDGNRKVATFPKATLCGWSVTEYMNPGGCRAQGAGAGPTHIYDHSAHTSATLKSS